MSVIWIVNKGRLIDVYFLTVPPRLIVVLVSWAGGWLLSFFPLTQRLIFDFLFFHHLCFAAPLCCMGWLLFLFDCSSRLHLCWLLFSFSLAQVDCCFCFCFAVAQMVAAAPVNYCFSFFFFRCNCLTIWDALSGQKPPWWLSSGGWCCESFFHCNHWYWWATMWKWQTSSEMMYGRISVSSFSTHLFQFLSIA